MDGQCKQTFTKVDQRILENIRGFFFATTVNDWKSIINVAKSSKLGVANHWVCNAVWKNPDK